MIQVIQNILLLKQIFYLKYLIQNYICKEKILKLDNAKGIKNKKSFLSELKKNLEVMSYY